MTPWLCHRGDAEEPEKPIGERRGLKREGGDSLFLDLMLELPGIQVCARGKQPIQHGAVGSLCLWQMQFLIPCL